MWSDSQLSPPSQLFGVLEITPFTSLLLGPELCRWMSRQFCEQRHLGLWCVPASVGQLPLLWPLSSCPRDAPESELGRDAPSCHWVRAGSSPPLVRCLPVEGTLCTGPFHVTSLGLQPSARTAASHAPVHAARSRCRPNVLVTAQAVRQ